MANLRKDTVKPAKPKASAEDKAAVAAGVSAVGCLGFIVLAKLAFYLLIAWGIFELVTWVTSK